MVELRQVLKEFEAPVPRKLPEEFASQRLEELGKERQAFHDRFLEEGWQLAEWAPLRCWQGLEQDIAALSVLGRQLREGHRKLLESCGGYKGSMAAVKEYQELGRKLEEGVKFSCPWPQLREVKGRPKTQPANLSLQGGLSPSLGRRPEACKASGL